MNMSLSTISSVLNKGIMQFLNWQKRISVNPSVRSGKPCIERTCITVYDVLEYLEGGMSEDEILADFPNLMRDDIRAAWRSPQFESAAC